MGEYLSFVSLDTWTLIFTWLNLLILFFVLKKLFFNPMEKMLESRKREIEADYKRAEADKAAANEIREEYELLMTQAGENADKITAQAKMRAEEKSSVIIKEAETKAEGMIKRARIAIEKEKESALSALRGSILSISVDIARKIIGSEIDKTEHERLINSAMEGLGGENE